MAVGEFDFADGGFANVGDDVGGSDGIVSDEFCNRGAGGRFAVDEAPNGGFFEESDAPAVGVFVGEASSFGKAFKGELNVGGGVAVHSEQLAHGSMEDVVVAECSLFHVLR